MTGVALVALVATLAVVPPATAEMTITRDVADTGMERADIKKVTLHHWKKRVKIKTRMFADSKLPDEMWHFVDTKGDRRPEFVVFSVIQSEVDDKAYAGVHRVDEWPTRKNKYRVLRRSEDVDCGLEAARRADRRRLLVLTLGRGCFRSDGTMPERLRVNTFGTFEWGKITDAVPRWRGYGAWVEAG